MLFLKSAYFFFLALKINIIKKIKKIYFTTNLYNKSLESKIPRQFYFYPNPFLLSSLTSHKNFIFKLSDINEENFWSANIVNKKDETVLNSFLWLNLIDRKNEASTIQKIIFSWIQKNSEYKKLTWGKTLISKRIISWLLNADIILKNTDNLFKQNFFHSIMTQVNHLKKNLKFENNYSEKVEAISAILLSGLVFKEYYKNFEDGLSDLNRLVDDLFDNDGFPKDRNPSHLVKFSKYFILIRECIKDAQKYVPDFLDEIIDKNLLCIKSISSPSNKLPLFNGATNTSLDEYFNFVEVLGYKFKKTKSKVGDLQILKNKKHFICIDIGSAPKKNFSNCYQSGPLSFEYYNEKDKIITNCGFGLNISKKAILLSRLTSAQSTLCLDDSSVTKFERNRIINSAFGNSVIYGFKVLKTHFSDNNTEVEAGATHNAYEASQGYHHKRSVKISKNNNVISGVDEVIRKKENQVVKFSIRFHLNPGISAVQTMGGKSILIQISKNKSLIFKSYGERLSLEKSIFLGGNKILNNLCINITGDVISNIKKINWEIRKNI